jgi:hypothetical protein
MTVRELIESLLVLDPEREVYLDANGGEYVYGIDAVEVREDGEVYIV